MAEYIKIEKNTFPTFYKRNLTDYGKGWNACLKSVLQHKTADVVEVKHGKWIHFKSTAGGINDIYKCSVCDHITGWVSPYCSQCGAEMDKRSEGK